MSAYLALLGGTLLAIRFWHAHLPVTQAVSAVPVAALISTALVQLVVPLLAILAFGAVGVFIGWLQFFVKEQRARSRSSGGPSPSPGRRKSKIDPAIFTGLRIGLLVVVGAALPFDVWGGVVLLSAVVFFFPELWLGRLTVRLSANTGSRMALLMVCVYFAAASLVVLARQAVEPLNMEVVSVELPNTPPMVGDLVAIRDGSVVLARCHRLVVVPAAGTISVVQGLPTELWTSSRSIEQKLGLDKIGVSRVHADVVARRMPC